MYLFVAAVMFVFTACSGEKTPAQEANKEVVVSCTFCGEEVCLAMGEGPCLEDCSCCTNVEEEDMRGSEGIEEDKAIER